MQTSSMTCFGLKLPCLNPLEELFTEVIILQKYILFTHLQYYFDDTE
jgi:hypothetical protein